MAEEAFDHEQRGQRKLYGRIKANYDFFFADKRKRDLANFEKGITDFLVKKGVIEDDSMIDDLRLVREASDNFGGSFVQIKLEVISV